MLKLFSKSFRAIYHLGSSLFSPGKRDVNDECVTPDNTVTRLYEQGTWKKRTGYFLGVWLVWGTCEAGKVADMGINCGIFNAFGQTGLLTECDVLSWSVKHDDEFKSGDQMCMMTPDEKGWNEYLIWQGAPSTKEKISEYLRAQKYVLQSGVDDHTVRFSSWPFANGSEKSAGFSTPPSTNPYYIMISGDYDWSSRADGCQYKYDGGRYTHVPLTNAPQSAGGLFATYNGLPIEHFTETASLSLGTLYDASYPAGESVVHSFTLDNFGAERSVAFSLSQYRSDTMFEMASDAVGSNKLYVMGSGSSDFSISPSTLTIPAGTYGAPGQATFDISFKPSGKGLRQAWVDIDQDGENEIRFLIQGGTESPIQLRGGDEYHAVGDMDETPREEDGTDFLSQKISDDPTTHIFTLLNKETRDITVITALRDATTGFSLSEQSVVVPAATEEGVVGGANFDITFDPATTGIHETFVDLSYDGERQLSFKISGEGESGGGGAVSPLGLGLLGLLLAGLGYRRYRMDKQIS